MTSTVFTNGVTLTDSDWFNDVDRLHYTIFADAADVTAAKVAIKAHPRMYIAGMAYAHGDGAGGGDQTNDWTIAAGEAVDSTGVRLMQLSAITKQIDASWAVGTGAGGLDTGSVGNSDYYIWLIVRIDTGVVDVLFSLSSTAPTMPANYTLKRLIGWFKRVGATNVLADTYETEGGGIEMKWRAPTLDVNQANTLTTARRTDAVKVPLNFSTIALLRVYMLDGTSQFEAAVTCPDETDAAPTHTAAPGLDIVMTTVATGVSHTMAVRTSAAGLIAARATLATVDLYNVFTLGFRWARRN